MGGQKRKKIVQPTIRLQCDQRNNKSDHFIHLNLMPRPPAAESEQLCKGLELKEPFSDTTIDQPFLDRVTLDDSMRELIQKFSDQVNERFDLMEARILGEGRDAETVETPDLKSEELIFSANLSDEASYPEWSKSIQAELKALKQPLHVFLRYQPIKDNEKAIKIDQLVKKAILSTIGPQIKAKIDLNGCRYTKQVWTRLRELFEEKLLRRVAQNMAYLTRTNISDIRDVENHVERFRNAVLELQAVDIEICERALTEMFLSSFSEELFTFYSMMRSQVSKLKMDYEQSLNHAVAQSNFFVQMSNETEKTKNAKYSDSDATDC